MLAQRIALCSPLPPDDVDRRLRSATRAPVPLSNLIEFRRLTGSAAFVGTFEGDGFAVRRDIRYRNSFLPRISGSVQAATDGTRIELRFAPHPLVFAFMALWLCIAGMALIGLIAWRATAPAGSPFWPIAVPAGMLAMGVALPWFAYRVETRLATTRFVELLDATPVPDDHRPR